MDSPVLLLNCLSSFWFYFLLIFLQVFEVMIVNLSCQLHWSRRHISKCVFEGVSKEVYQRRQEGGGIPWAGPTLSTKDTEESSLSIHHHSFKILLSPLFPSITDCICESGTITNPFSLKLFHVRYSVTAMRQVN